MWWLVFPVFGSILYCVGGYSQNYLTDNAIQRGRAGSYVVLRLIGHIAAIILLLSIFGRAVFMMPLQNAAGLMLAGAINVVGSAFHCKALQKGDNADISIFGQVSPVISLGLGVLILGESITANQGLGFVCIMGSIMYVILSNNTRRGGPNASVAATTVVASFFSILSDIVYSYFLFGTADYMHFAQAFFFFELGSVLITILACIFFESWRKAVKKAFFAGPRHKQNLVHALSENLTFIVADVLYKPGLMLAPVKSLVSVVGRVVNLFSSLFITIFFGRVFPKFISARRPSKKTLMQYGVAAIFIVVGLVLIN